MPTSASELTVSSGHINCWNVANALFYGMNAAVYIFARFEVFGSPNKVLFEQHRTVVTPGEEVLAITPFIFLFEGVFVLAQLTPWYRDHPVVTLITPMWVLRCMFHCQWLVELSRGEPYNLAYSMAMCFGTLGAVLAIILVVDARKLTFLEFWLLRAPFSFHAGWLICVCAMNVNMWVTSVVDPAFSASARLSVAILSLAFIFAVTALFAINTRRPDPLLVLPVMWGTFWIWRNNANEDPNMPTDMIVAADLASAHVYSGCCVLFVFAFVMRMRMVCLSSRKLEDFYQEGNYKDAVMGMVNETSDPERAD